MDERVDVTVPMEAEMNDRIEAQLSYGDSKSGLIRTAIEEYLDRLESEETDATE